jgi:hypothetical protein
MKTDVTTTQVRVDSFASVISSDAAKDVESTSASVAPNAFWAMVCGDSSMDLHLDDDSENVIVDNLSACEQVASKQFAWADVFWELVRMAVRLDDDDIDDIVYRSYTLGLDKKYCKAKHAAKRPKRCALLQFPTPLFTIKEHANLVESQIDVALRRRSSHCSKSNRRGRPQLCSTAEVGHEW